MMQLGSGYGTSNRVPPHLYGYHYPAFWTRYLNAVAKLGQTKTKFTVADVLTNDLVRAGQREGRQGASTCRC